MNFEEKKLSEKHIYKGKIIDVHVDTVSLPNGNKSVREVVEHPGGVCVAAMNDNNELIFVKQYRYPFKEVILELPAGKLEKGESDPLESGKRELKEETGATGCFFEYLGKMYPSPGYIKEILYMYFCRVKEMGKPSPDENELLEIKTINISKAVDMVLKGEIIDAKTALTILKTNEMLKRGLI
jgi:ADP-ribose pyrophosphatase